MPFLAFPLRLRQTGVLHRADEAAAMLSFLHVMAVTPGGTWRACPSFGLRDLLESGWRTQDMCRAATDRANQALADLGITGYRVEEITRESTSDASLAVFSLKLREISSSRTYLTQLSTDTPDAPPDA